MFQRTYIGNMRPPGWKWECNFTLLFPLKSVELSCQLSNVPRTERAQSHATNANKIIERIKTLAGNNETKFNIGHTNI
jgi:hypothetical protein